MKRSILGAYCGSTLSMWLTINMHEKRTMYHIRGFRPDCNLEVSISITKWARIAIDSENDPSEVVSLTISGPCHPQLEYDEERDDSGMCRNAQCPPQDSVFLANVHCEILVDAR